MSERYRRLQLLPFVRVNWIHNVALDLWVIVTGNGIEQLDLYSVLSHQKMRGFGLKTRVTSQKCKVIGLLTRRALCAFFDFFNRCLFESFAGLSLGIETLKNPVTSFFSHLVRFNPLTLTVKSQLRQILLTFDSMDGPQKCDHS